MQNVDSIDLLHHVLHLYILLWKFVEYDPLIASVANKLEVYTEDLNVHVDVSAGIVDCQEFEENG